MAHSAPLPRRVDSGVSVAMRYWPLWAGLLALAVPTILTLGSETWTSESGAQGPIVLATGGWLISRCWPDLTRPTAESRAASLAIVLFLLGVSSYVFGRAYDFLTAEVAGLYVIFLAVAMCYFGWLAILRNWFPFLYLATAIPLPAFLLVQITSPLKHFVAELAILCVAPTGLPVMRDGVTIIVGEYQLLVEDACSGMNSLMSLICLGLFYLYITRRASVGYSLIMTIVTIPIAIVANVIRIVMLIMITYFFGDAAGQSFLHFAAGVLLFAIALGLIMLIDRAICGPVRLTDEDGHAPAA